MADGSIPGGIFGDNPEDNSDPESQSLFTQTLTDDDGNPIDFNPATNPGATHFGGGAGENDYYEVGEHVIGVTHRPDTAMSDSEDSLIIDGTAGSAAASGNDGNNSILANDAGNVLFGGDGKDTLIGGAGNDILSGGTGNDSLVGGAGNDTMTGGSGSDIFVVKAAPPNTGDVTINDMGHGYGNHDELHIVGHQHGDGHFTGSDYTIADNSTDSSVAVGDVKITFNGDAGSVTLKGVGDASHVDDSHTDSNGDTFFTVT